MAARCAAVILGSNKPLVVLVKSNCAEAAGVVVPIPTFWPLPVIIKEINDKTR